MRSARSMLVAALAALAGNAWAAPPAVNASHAPATFIEALRPEPGRRPVVAVLALNDRTEMTDLLLPHAVLKRADVAEVHIVAPRAGTVKLFPALQIDGALSFERFAQRHPEGPDYIIVPAMERDDDPAVTTWLHQQAQRGAKVIGICSGARVVGRAGLLDGRRFSGHWYDRKTLLKRHPGSQHVPDQRYLIDRGVATSTGITASVPTMLALVEAIGGTVRAAAVAQELGVSAWGPTHDSARFGLSFSRGLAYVRQGAAFWLDERWQVDVHDGMDDIALALAADAWARTGRVRVEAASPSGAVQLRSGLRLLTHAPDDSPRLPLDNALKPVPQLDRTLCEIAARHGDARRDRVLLEMEYAGPEAPCP
ncbi:DJ-1/PfpI family protein [Piscinibacter sp. HJYY11]|nr:DJ-1/PfpI family protein [Piscinibacter sp. HJYY11]